MLIRIYLTGIVYAFLAVIMVSFFAIDRIFTNQDAVTTMLHKPKNKSNLILVTLYFTCPIIHFICPTMLLLWSLNPEKFDNFIREILNKDEI